MVLLSVSRQVAVDELIAVEALVSTGVDTVENRRWEAGMAPHVYFIGCQDSGSAHSVFVGKIRRGEVGHPGRFGAR